jgi:spectinomycin phosphotransferase
VLGAFHRIPVDVIRQALVAGWALAFGELEYFPEGAGAYHWITRTADGRRWFVTCDDLDAKPWIGSDRGSVLTRLTAAYAAAMELHASGLGFVSAPVADVRGAPLVCLDARHTVSVFPFVDGERWHWGKRVAKGTTADLLSVLAELHASTPAGDVARDEFDVPLRAELERALDEVGRPWQHGPLAEAARDELQRHGGRISRWLEDFDDQIVSGAPTVLTHGEPHPDNVIPTPGGLVLVDWDTTALAPPERDLWMLTHAGTHIADAYRDLTGVRLDPGLLAAYRARWALADIATFTGRLRGEHADDADTRKAIEGLRSILDGPEPAPWRRRSHARAIGKRLRR